MNLSYGHFHCDLVITDLIQDFCPVSLRCLYLTWSFVNPCFVWVCTRIYAFCIKVLQSLLLWFGRPDKQVIFTWGVLPDVTLVNPYFVWILHLSLCLLYISPTVSWHCQFAWRCNNWKISLLLFHFFVDILHLFEHKIVSSLQIWIPHTSSILFCRKTLHSKIFVSAFNHLYSVHIRQRKYQFLKLLLKWTSNTKVFTP